MSRDGSRRDGDRGEFNSQQVEPDDRAVWVVAGSESRTDSSRTLRPKAGDLSNSGKISKIQPLTLSSVFAGMKDAENKLEATPQTNSSSNMFSMFSGQGAEAGDNGKSK